MFSLSPSWFLVLLVSFAPTSFACDGELVGEAERKGVERRPDTADGSLKELGTKAKGDAETASVYLHQQALLEAFSMERLLLLGLNYRSAKNFREAIVKSDMGKLAVYKEFLTTNSADNVALIEALQLRGNGPLTTVLREINKGKPFLNPALSVELLTQIFAAAPALVGYFHEFPGMRVAEKERQDRAISATDFREVILGIYGHNGPGHPTFRYESELPFWSKVPDFIRGGIEKAITEGKLPAAAREIFKDTIFESPDGHRYHEPQSPLGFEHMTFDRFDGYRDSRKIRSETIGLYGAFKVEIEMLFKSGFTPTLAALRYDRDELLPAMRRDGRITQAEFERLSRTTELLFERAEFMNREFKKRVEDVDKLLAEDNPTQITFLIPQEGSAPRRVTFEVSSLQDPGAAKAFGEFVDNNLRGPVIELDRQRTQGIYQILP